MERRALRLAAFDYASAGLYFVTTCTHARACVFGVVENEAVRLSPLGAIARARLEEIPQHHVGLSVDSYVVMPNHVHALFALDGPDDVELGDVVGTYKAAVSRGATRRRIWQRGYYDHIVRNEEDLERIREYIATNPIQWALDPENSNRRT